MASEAQLKAAKKWNDNNLKQRYDRIQLLVPKGQREVIKQAARNAAFCVGVVSPLIISFMTV